jgi:predicted kinase
MENSQVIDAARKLADSIESIPTPQSKPSIVIISGLPGTGKTYFSQRLAERLPFVILESDALRKQLFPTPSYSAEESACLFRAIFRLMEALVKKGTPVILDATNLSEKNREPVYRIAERLNARLVPVRVTAPLELVRQRLRGRTGNSGNNSDADWAVYQEMKPTEQRINRHHFTVDTSRDITPVIDKIVKEITR